MLISKLSQDEAYNLDKIKNRFGYTTNSQAVSYLLSYYIPKVDEIARLEKELQSVKSELWKRKIQTSALFDSLACLKEFAEANYTK